MKLSELFRTPFKLKGGSTLNLRGFSKRIVDKEVGGDTNIFSELLDSFIKNYPNEYLQDKVVDSEDTIIDIKEATDGTYKLLYKKSFIESLESNAKIIYAINLTNEQFLVSGNIMGVLNIDEEFNINRETYYTLIENQG